MNGVGTRGWGGVAVCIAMGAVLLAGMAGCGSDGSSRVDLGCGPVPEGQPIPESCLPQQIAKITGIVWAPGGIFASAESPSWFAKIASFSFVSKALARFSFLEPVGIGVEVALSEVTEVDVADGVIDNPMPIAQFAHTNADGVFEILNEAGEQVERCRMVLSVGSTRTGDLTRALVHSNNVNVDPASEAVVRIVLRRIHQTDTQLCDFNEEGLRAIVREAEIAASQVSGSSVQEANDLAYQWVSRDCEVLELIEAVTQRSFNPPIRRTNRGDCEVNL